MKTKICNKCNQEKPLERYSVSKSNKDGKRGDCKDCDSIRNKLWVINNPKRKKQLKLRYERSEKGMLAAKKRRERRPKGIDNHYKYAWDKRNPEKRKAYSKVRNAIKYKKMIKQPCFKCGCEKVEAHHEDYSRPLDVMWLCRKCHAQIHRIYK